MESEKIITEKYLLSETIKILGSNEYIKQRYSAKAESFRQQLIQAKLDKYRLGVIGVTSSGKSTMINAIMKKNLLSTAVRPSSSQIVSCSKSTQDKVTVYFEDKPPAVETGNSLKSIIKKYSDERSNPQNKLHVKQLELSTKGFSFPDEILLIDSPGLDAYGFEGHEKLTMNSLLPTIDFCMFVTTCQTNSDEKMKNILDTIAEYDCPLIIVQNKIDSIRPDPEGKKSISDIADEHRRRIERIVDASKIKDKNSIYIIQISSKWALKAFTEKMLTKEERKNYFQKSNFSALTDAVEKIFALIYPKIENRRLTKLRNELSSIVEDASQDLVSTKQERENLKFKYEKYDEKIIGIYKKAVSEITYTLGNFENSKKSYLSVSRFYDSTIEEIKNTVKNTEDKIISITKDFNKNISEYCSVFNIDERRIRTLESFGSQPELKIHNKTENKWVEKRGFFSWLARGLGDIFGTDWGYEQQSEEKYDHEATRKNVENYFDAMYDVFSHNCESWKNSANVQKEILLNKYINEYKDYESRKNSLIDKEKTEQLITKLKDLIQLIPYIPEAKKDDPVNISAPVLSKELHLSRMDKCTYSLVKLTEKFEQSLHMSVFRKFTGMSEKDECIIIGWDNDSTCMFAKNNLNCSVSENKKNIRKKLKVLVKPDPEILRTVIEKSSEKCFIFIIFNVSQYGSALNELKNSNILNMLKGTEQLFFVVQDLAELITGDGIKEGMENMLSIGKSLGSDTPYRIMFNHSSPVYNLALAEIQERPCLTYTDTIAVISDIQKRFPYLRNTITDKYISEIISCLKNKKES